jgi:hypothetical protein
LRTDFGLLLTAPADVPADEPPRGPPPPARPLVVGAVTMHLAGLFPEREVAVAYGVSLRTLYRWRRDLLAEPGPDGDLIRRLARRTGPPPRDPRGDRG